MRKYEIMVLLKPNLDKEQVSKVLSPIEKKYFDEIVQKEEWGLKKLAYPIKKEQEGYYVLYYLNLDETKILDLKKTFNFSKEILRTLIVKHDKKFPFEMKTSKELKFPERKPRPPYTRGERDNREGRDSHSHYKKRDKDTTSTVEESK